MKQTGKINPFTKEEIMEVELTDLLPLIDKDFSDLTLDQKANFCSFMNISAVPKGGWEAVEVQWKKFVEKHKRVS